MRRESQLLLMRCSAGACILFLCMCVCVCVLLGSECDELLVVIWPWDLYSVL
jgi:hypothetical protein